MSIKKPQGTPLSWRKSSYSAENGECIEVAQLAVGGVAVRDSKQPDGPQLAFPAASFAHLVRTVSLGR